MSRALVVGALLRATVGLLVTPESPCATKCGNVLDSTTEDMLVCEEAAYGLTSEGQVYKDCISCEATSPYSTTQENRNISDLQYLIYNLRYTVSTCLYEAATNPCITTRACGPLQDAVEYDGLAPNVSTYGYCSLWSDYQLEQCSNCLSASLDGHYLNNFMSLLSGACKLQLEPPSTIPFEGDLFSSDKVNVTDPTPTATFTPSHPTGPLDYGQIAGIAVGGVVFLLMIIGCGVIINGKRRRKAYLRRREENIKNWPTPQGGGGEMFETPISQRPLNGWNDSPVSAATPTTFPQYFSPYNSQYNSPVTAIEGPSHAAWPVEKAQSIGVALSPDHDPLYTHWGDKKGKDKMDTNNEGYELQEGIHSAGGYGYNVPPPPPLPSHAPMLSHPGYGRHGAAPRAMSQEEMNREIYFRPETLGT